MKMGIRIGFVCAVLAATGAFAAGGNSQANRISKDEATAKALATAPGSKVQSAEFEHEKGKDVWSFDLKRPGQRGTREVLVDANNGNIVSNTLETPAQESSEAKADSQQQGRAAHGDRLDK